MTTMILTMIGILIAGAAALMVIYYGGDAMYSSEYKAEASRLTVEGSQIEQAIASYEVRHGRDPRTFGGSESVFSELISKKFLAQKPPGGGQPWVIDYNHGLIRSDIGSTADERAQQVCIAARSQQKLTYRPMPYLCDGSDHPSGKLPTNEPCCIFNPGAEAPAPTGPDDSPLPGGSTSGGSTSGGSTSGGFDLGPPNEPL